MRHKTLQDIISDSRIDWKRVRRIQRQGHINRQEAEHMTQEHKKVWVEFVKAAITSGSGIDRSKEIADNLLIHYINKFDKDE